MITSKSTTEDIKIWLVEVGLDIVCAKFEGMFLTQLAATRGHMACARTNSIARNKLLIDINSVMKK
jgi:hypothetical protein